MGNAPPAPTWPVQGGSLLEWLQNGLGGALAGGAAGGIVSGGLSELIERLEQNGLGDAGHSWSEVCGGAFRLPVSEWQR